LAACSGRWLHCQPWQTRPQIDCFPDQPAPFPKSIISLTMNSRKPDPYQPCPCGSGRKYKFCCHATGLAVVKEHPQTLIKNSLDYPVTQCFVNRNWQEQGLATVFVIRQLPNSKYIAGVYLVDVYCLGVKDAFCNANLASLEIQKMQASSGLPMVEIDYEDARSLVLGGLDYAKQHGFESHEDWHDACYVIDPERAFVPKFSFGSGGAPLYVQGPFDDVEANTQKAKGMNQKCFSPTSSKTVPTSSRNSSLHKLPRPWACGAMASKYRSTTAKTPTTLKIYLGFHQRTKSCQISCLNVGRLTTWCDWTNWLSRESRSKT